MGQFVDGDWTAAPDAAAPEPGTLALVGMGVMALGRSALRRGVVAVKYENPPYDLQEAGPPTNIGGPEVPPAPHTLGELNPMPMPAEFSQLDITSTAARIREQKKIRANGFWRLMDDPTQKGYF